MAEFIKFKKKSASNFINNKLLKNKAVLIVLFIGLAVIVAGGAYFIYSKNVDRSTDEVKLTVTELSRQFTPCSFDESDSILDEAIVTINPSMYAPEEQFKRIEKLTTLQSKILGLDNYLNDANCLHILAMISIIKSNIDDAENYINLLEKKAQETSPDIYILDEVSLFMPLEKMREYVDGSKKNSEILKNNELYIYMETQSAE